MHLTRQDDRLLFSWASYDLTIELSRVRESGRETRAEVIVKMNKGVVIQFTLDLLNLSTRIQVAHHIEKRPGNNDAQVVTGERRFYGLDRGEGTDRGTESIGFDDSDDEARLNV
jgi:hypothetical protein